MNTEISASEACQAHLLTEEDFARMCNEDGSLKSQSSTTFTFKDDPSKSITVSNSTLYISGMLFILVITCIVVLFVRRRRVIK